MSISNRPKVSDITVRRGVVNSVELYEVKEHELIQLEKGLEADLFFNFAIFLYSLAFASLLTLVSADFKKAIFQTAAVFVLIIGALGGTFLMILWKRNKQPVTETIKTIRNRLPPDVIPQATDTLHVEDSVIINTQTTILPPNENIPPAG